jgi:mRNA interferase RelE/StbE
VVNYKIFIKPSAKKELESLPKNDLNKIVEKIKNLSINPRPDGAEKLSGEDKYRVRQGNYRILYTIEDVKIIVIVIKIGHRRDIYRKK